MPEEDVFKVEVPVTPEALSLLRTKTDALLAVETRLDNYKKVAADLNEERDKLRENIIEILKIHNLSSQKWDDGLMVMRVSKKYPSVPAEMQDKFKRFLMRVGLWHAAKVPTQTVVAMLKDRLEHEQYIPSYVKVFVEDTLSVKGKAQAQQRSGHTQSPQEVPAK